MSKTIIFLILLFQVFGDTYSKADKPDSTFQIAYALYLKKDYNTALTEIAFSGLNSQSQKAADLVIRGFVFTDSLSFDQGRIYFEKAEKLLENSEDIRLKCKNYFGLGRGFFNNSDYKNAVNVFFKMDYAAGKANLKAEQKTANYYLAMNYQRLDKIPISQNYITKAISLAKDINDTASLIRCYYVLSSNYLWWADKDTNPSRYGDSIIAIILKAEKYIQNNNPAQMGMLADLYSKAYSYKNDHEKSIFYAKEALQDYMMTNDSFNLLNCYIIVGGIYLDSKQYDSALFYSKRAEEFTIFQDGFIDKRRFYLNLSRIYKNLKDTSLAYVYLEKYFDLDYELNEKNNLDVQQLREDFEKEKTNLQIINEKEKASALFKQKRNFIVYISVALIILLIVTAYFIYNRLQSQKEKENAALKLLLQNAELTALKAQMNPHFIFNALNSIQHSIVSNKSEDAYRFLSKFAKLIRNVLDNSSEQLISLKTEIETLSLYIDIESKRFDHSFASKITVSENGFETDKFLVPPMILQPLVENAIWHGLMPKTGEKILELNFNIITANSLICELIDNGIGREKARQIASEKNKQHKSKGLSNITDRINLIDKTHSIKISVETIDLLDGNMFPAGTKVIIKIYKNDPRK